MSVDKVTKSDVEDALAYFKIKCDAEYLPADAVATKLYDKLGTATDGAVNQATVTEELSKKADSDTVTAELVKKANTADVNTALSKKLDSDATAVKATKFETARSLKVSLASAAAQTFDGSSDATNIGVAGTLPVANGGTGQTAIINNTTVGPLGWNSSTGARAITSNTLAYWNGAYAGTNSNLAYYKNGAFGTIATCNSPLPIANGGTGKTNLNDVTVGRATNDGAGNNIASTYVPKALSQSLEAQCWLPYAGAGSPDQADLLKFNLLKSGFYSAVCQTNTQIFVSNAANNWLNVINLRHDNACKGGDQTKYGMLIYSPMTVAGNLYWRQQVQNTWQAEKVIIDSANISSYIALSTTASTVEGAMWVVWS